MLQLSLVDRVGSRALGVFELAGAIATFGAHAIVEAVRPPYELREIVRHAYQFGYRSTPLILTAGVAIGVVLSMHTRIVIVAQLLAMTALLAVPLFAADDEALKKDLTAVIALQGLPCGQVVAVTVLADSDYAASCKDGNMYRVYLNAAGRVIVEKRK